MNTPPLIAYRWAAWALGGAGGQWLIRRRLARGKEDPARHAERLGAPGLARPEGGLVWIHAASVGESVSALPLIARLRRERPDLAVLLTSGTLTSARLIAQRAPEGVLHQFAPIDTPAALERFLDHWRPDFYASVESEIWPNLLWMLRRRGVKTALVSARLSERSARGWAWAPRSIAALLASFDLIVAQTDLVAQRLLALGAARAQLRTGGALKAAAEPPSADPATLARWRALLAGRPVWLAASTHPGEEVAVCAAHRALGSAHPGLLTLIAPRHPERGAEVAAAAAADGLSVARRSLGEAPGAETDVYVVDTLGELGLWYRVAPVSFVGGSLAPHGGHNPLEPAQLGSAVVLGPHMENFDQECAELERRRAARRFARADELAPTIDALIGPSAAAQAQIARAAEIRPDESVVLRTLEAIEPLLPRRAGAPASETGAHAAA